MSLILDSVMCATVDDEARFRKIIDQLIKSKVVKKLKVYLLAQKVYISLRCFTAFVITIFSLLYAYEFLFY